MKLQRTLRYWFCVNRRFRSPGPRPRCSAGWRVQFYKKLPGDGCAVVPPTRPPLAMPRLPVSSPHSLLSPFILAVGTDVQCVPLYFWLASPSCLCLCWCLLSAPWVNAWLQGPCLCLSWAPLHSRMAGTQSASLSQHTAAFWAASVRVQPREHHACHITPWHGRSLLAHA